MEYNFWEAFLRVVIFLPIVGGLAYFIIKFGVVKKYYRNQTADMEIIDRIALSPKSTLNIVKVGEQYLLIGSTDNSINLIKELENYQGKNEINEQQLSFADFLKRFKGGNSGDE